MWTPANNLEAGALSDLPVDTPTPTPNNNPPGAIGDLAASPGCASGSLALSWTAPGEYELYGTASSYLVRYAASPISDQAAWEAATPVSTGLPDPLKAGTRQSMTVSGLTPAAAIISPCVRAAPQACWAACPIHPGHKLRRAWRRSPGR